MVKQWVIGRANLELALTIGLSAPVVGMIGNDLGLESPLIHIWGESTEGKTTAAMLAISVFGFPNIREEKGLMRNWNTTVISTGEHSIYGKSKQNTGLYMRLLEFGNVQWTESAEQSEKINVGIVINI